MSSRDCWAVACRRACPTILGSIGSAGSLAGGVPKIDLSACLPTGLPSVLPIH
ncbi:MAG: hypothetical protein ABR511_06140 [Acidimicrobiales bacterium]